MMPSARRRIGSAGALALVLLTVVGAAADEIDDLAALPPADGVPRLEALLEEAGGAGDTPKIARLQRVLADVHLKANAPYAALPHLEALATSRGEPEDSVAYAQALLAVARRNITDQAMGRSVMPFLRDALDAVKGLNLASHTRHTVEPTLVLAPSLRADLVLVVVEARYLLQEYDEALAGLGLAEVGEQPAVGGLPETALTKLRDLQGRILYARARFAEAAAAFEHAGNALGAAAAWDAARQPDKSVPLYAAAIRAEPANAGLIERALAGTRFTGAHAPLLAALADVALPDGHAGIPLLIARAELLESTGGAKDALPLLREVARRDTTNADALVTLGRLLIVTGDAEGEDTWDESAAAYTEALKRDPVHDGAVAGLAFIAGRDFGRLWQVWRAERVVARCLRVQQAMVAAAPDDALAWANLGNTLRILGRSEESLAAYKQAREANPFDPAVESDAGLALSGAGRAEEALTAYLRSLELDPGHLAGRQNAARALWLKGDDEAAARQLGAAVRTARAVGRSPWTYRFLLDRAWRTHRNPGLR